MSLIVLGRFPPPIDGQSLATERLASLLESDLDVERINTQPPQRDAVEGGRRLRRAVHFLRQLPRLRRLLSVDPEATIFWPAVSPDLLGHFRDLVVTVPSFRPKQRIYAVVHRGNFHRMFERPISSATARQLVGRLQGFVFNTEHLSERCARWIPYDKRIVIPNTIDDELILPDSEVADKQQSRRRRERLWVLFLSHMLPSKGYLDALEGIIRARRSGVEIDAHFAGGWQSPTDREAFFDRVRGEGLEGTIRHHGAIHDRSAIKKLYRNADVLLLPTYYQNEAQPHVLIEALNAGTPVITTPHAGIPEMIRDGKEGLLVLARNPAAIADAIRRMADIDFWQTMSREARRTYLNVYAPDKVRKRWKELVHESSRIAPRVEAL